mmetsp:Transcript_126191/g.353373  ORF Transcript_126191/g.353373 Transcript_126191/m.353373 type:complete len:311 (+) Transcript_126191:584-1516(+)
MGGRELARCVPRVQPLQHCDEGRVAPLRNLDLSLVRLGKVPAAKHRPEVLALGDEDRLVGVDLLTLHDEGDVAEVGAIQQLPHVLDERVDSNIVERALFESADVQDMQVVQPLRPVEAAEDVDPLGANQGGAVPLPARRRVRRLRGPRWSHPLVLGGVKDVELIRSALAIVATEEEYLVTDQVRRVPAQTRRRSAQNLRLLPLQLLRVEHVQVCQVLVAAVAAEEVQLRADERHGVRISGLRRSAGQAGLHPRHGLEINDVHVVEALLPVVTAEHVQLVREPRQSVARPRRRRRAGGVCLVPSQVVVGPG